MRFNWARSEIGTQAIVKTPKTRAITHSVLGAIHNSAVMHVSLRLPLRKPKAKKKPTPPKKRKTNKDKGVKRAADEIDDEQEDEHDEQEQEQDQDNQVVDPEEEDPITGRKVSKGTTTLHFIKFINELLDVMDKDEKFQNSYLVFDNVSIHKYDPLYRKIEQKGYHVCPLPAFSPELNAIEQFWGNVKGKMKRSRMNLTEENLSSRIKDASNAVPASNLYNFCAHSKCTINNCYTKRPM